MQPAIAMLAENMTKNVERETRNRVFKNTCEFSVKRISDAIEQHNVACLKLSIDVVQFEFKKLNSTSVIAIIFENDNRIFN